MVTAVQDDELLTRSADGDGDAFFPAARGVPAHSVTARVNGNVYAARTGETGPQPVHPTTVIWRSAQGRVLKMISARTPEQLAAEEAAVCCQYPLACLSVEHGTSTSSSAGPARAAPVRGHSSASH